ncbi:PTS sugar transporter subunit IIA [Bacillus sp. AFS055030]|uniref:PTS sugar transporter subunit IIA n=1 Tax=Bacillus sp. AFS055030 TaxID=2033507 RepID=UPI000BFD7226|nr:PTS sugar transporter subunit IIA [Bacillus sp. AFS055030]PGL72596.1 PTS sugar transporter subunit IIA [Bacillus sp. AFS055030]
MKEKKYLPSEYIDVIDKVVDWKTAVEIASQPLLKDHLITEQYVQNMIQSVEDNGPYMVLADYFALMHARPGEGVNEQSMSMLVTKEPVDLEGKKVKIFFVLAAEDNNSHLASLSHIMEIFLDTDKYQIVLSGDKEAIIQLFN